DVGDQEGQRVGEDADRLLKGVGGAAGERDLEGEELLKDQVAGDQGGDEQAGEDQVGLLVLAASEDRDRGSAGLRHAAALAGPGASALGGGRRASSGRSGC